MVRIEEFSDREIAEKKKFSRLVEITKELMGQHRIVETSTSFGLFNSNFYSWAHVSPNLNKLEVYSPNHLDMAVKLAKAYETETGKEFTVKKRYQETFSQ